MSDDVWQRLNLLALAFDHAAELERDDALSEMATVLARLSLPEFRKIAYKAAVAHRTGDDPRLDRRNQENLLLGVVTDAAARRDSYEHMAGLIIGVLPNLPLLHNQAKTAPTWGVGRWETDYPEALERVTTAIKRVWPDPDNARDCKRIVKAAMRALGCDESFVKNMYREKGS